MILTLSLESNMTDLTNLQEIETTQELELEGKVFLVHKNQNGTEIDREELDGAFILQLLETLLTSDIESLMLSESLEESTNSL